jgi:hypothetical protein
MAKKVKFVIYPHVHRQYVDIDGELYGVAKQIDKEDYRKKEEARIEVPLVKIDAKEYERTLLELANELAPRVDVKQILLQSLRDLPMNEVMKVKKELKKKTPRIRRERGCVMLTVGKTSLTLRD